MKTALWFAAPLVALAACLQSDADPLAPNLSPDTTLRLMVLPTYDGSGQSIHPDVAFIPMDWGGGHLRLVVTPYPSGDIRQENPSIYAGHDGVNWTVPSKVANPIARAARGHLSDPALVTLADRRELWMYYREASDSNRVWLIRTGNGARWTRPELTAVAPNNRLISPTVVRRDGWEMWSVDGEGGCGAESSRVERRTSNDGIRWSEPQPVDMTSPVPGMFPWHVAVTWIPSDQRYWAVFNVKRAGGCATPAVFLATSRDGVSWHTFRRPLLTRGAIPEFSEIVYRASLLYDARSDMIRFWFSGGRMTNRGWDWRTATQSRSRTWLLDNLERPDAVAAALLAGRPSALVDSTVEPDHPRARP